MSHQCFVNSHAGGGQNNRITLRDNATPQSFVFLNISVQVVYSSNSELFICVSYLNSWGWTLSGVRLSELGRVELLCMVSSNGKQLESSSLIIFLLFHYLTTVQPDSRTDLHTWQTDIRDLDEVFTCCSFWLSVWANTVKPWSWPRYCCTCKHTNWISSAYRSPFHFVTLCLWCFPLTRKKRKECRFIFHCHPFICANS